ncbi:MAG: SusD/RagB family nutrient-binding outer membrane lipoprotein [Gemmatimonadota bacterium]
MNRATALLVASLTLGTSACDNFLDVNDNPNAPDRTSPNNYLAPMMHWLAQSEQWDGRFVGRYTQMWHIPPATLTGTPDNWARHGYDATSDNGAQIYRDVYWSLGINLSDMIRQAESEERWDLAGIGYVLRGWGWLKLTNLHGDVIIKEAFTPDQFRFPFDTQEYAYQEVIRLLDQGIELLARTDGNISPSYVAVGDKMFDGDASRWTRFAWGLKAMALNHFSNKSTYDANAVIAAVDKSFVSPAEEALFPFANTSPTPADDRNFWSIERGNIASYRQTEFIVGLMDGSQFTGAVDPRMSRMLAQDSTGAFRGMNINRGYGSVIRERPWNLWGYYGAGLQPAGTPGRYLFDYRPQYPVMTYAQLQFIKAEAALKKGDQAIARDAYLKGVAAHIDFVNARNAEISRPGLTQISAGEKAAFLANPAIAPGTITLSHIMGQKFIAQWGWAFVEAWMDQRRYHYTDMDPLAGTQVFRGFALPTNWHPDNGGDPAQRIRPRYNSDYVWNREELAKIGGLTLDYHTKPLWITER